METSQKGWSVERIEKLDGEEKARYSEKKDRRGGKGAEIERESILVIGPSQRKGELTGLWRSRERLSVMIIMTPYTSLFNLPDLCINVKDCFIFIFMDHLWHGLIYWNI